MSKLHEEIEELEELEEETCRHEFHDETPDEDGFGFQIVSLADPAQMMFQQATSEDGEEREEELEAKRRFEAERCPRCGRPHHKRSK